MQNSKCSMQNCQSGNNKRLTFRTDDGTFGVKGAQLPEDPKLYMCIVKLKDYEDLDVTPDEVERLLEKQIPRHYELWNEQCFCPNCNKLFGSYNTLKTLIHWEMPYCKFCGQALDWSDSDAKQ